MATLNILVKASALTKTHFQTVKLDFIEITLFDDVVTKT